MNIRNRPMTKIKKARIDRGMRVSDLAAIVGIDQGSMSRIENGQQQCRSRERVEKIATALGLEMIDVVFCEIDREAA